MPYITSSSHIPPFWLPGGHLQSIYPALFRKIHGVQYTRERIQTPDGDFLDLDWTFGNLKPGETRKLVVLSHGLEGNSTRQYITGMVRFLTQSGYDCLAWNFRSCSGEMNTTFRFYHSGATEDLDVVIQHAFRKNYSSIQLIGFSLGGNLTLKYLGERGAHLDSRIERSVVFSVPMDLKACSLAIIQPQNQIYQQRFLRTLKSKVTQKSVLFPDQIKISNYRHVRTLYDFDHVFTAPLHGFDSADDYYRKCSSLFFVKNIAIPTLIVNAANDPIVPFDSLPVAEITGLSQVWLESSMHGGHCGFRPRRLDNGIYWSEQRALEFLKNSPEQL